MLKPGKIPVPAPLLIAILGAVPALPGAFVLAGILAGPDNVGILSELVSPRYFAWPTPITIHIASGIVFCLLAPMQFSAQLRTRFPLWHRRAGRVAVAVGLIFALSALPLLTSLPPEAGWVRISGLGMAAIGVSLSLVLSLWTIRKHKVASHRAWMMRAIAFGLIGASRILLEGFAVLLYGEISETMGGTVIWLAVGLNLIIVQWHLKSPGPRLAHS